MPLDPLLDDQAQLHGGARVSDGRRSGHGAIALDSADSRRESGMPTSTANDGRHRVIDSKALLSDQRELAIRHKQSIYYLRETRFGKLILTK